MKTAAHGKDSCWRSLWRTASCERTFTQEQGQGVRSPPPEGQGAAETACDELTVTPIPCPPALLVRRRERNRSEAEPGKKGGVGQSVLRSGFIFSLSYSDLTGDELNSLFSPSSVCFVCDSNW